MKTLPLYIHKKINRNLKIIYLGFIGLMFIIQTVRILKYIPASAIKASYIIKFGSLLIPGSLMYVNVIISATIFYISYTSMLNTNETIAMKSSGFSNFKIITPAIKTIMANFTIFVLIGLFIQPLCNKTFDKMILNIKDGYVLSAIKAGQVTNFKNIAIYYDEIEGNQMKNFTILQTSEDEKQKIYYSLLAKYAKVQDYPDGAYLILQDSQSSKIIVNKGKALDIEKQTNITGQTKIKMSSILQKQQESIRVNEKNMTIIDLIRTAGSSKNAIIEINKRIMLPYYAIFPSLIIVIGLTSIKSSRGKNTKLLYTIISLASIFTILSFTLPSAIKVISIKTLLPVYLFPIFILWVFNKYKDRL